MIIPCLYLKSGKIVDPKDHQEIDVNLMPKFLAEISLCPEFAIICLDREPKTNAYMTDLVKMNSCSVQYATENVNGVMDLLDNGAKHFVVSKECLSDELPLSSLPQGRITLSFSHASLVKYSPVELAEEMSRFKEHVSRFLLYQTNFQTDLGLVEFAKELKKLTPHTTELVICTEEIASSSTIADLHLQGIDVQISMTCLLNDLSLGNIIASCVKSDRPDGLFPTIVTDEHGVALGLVYSNAESIQEAINTKKGVYFSRTRGLWRKGETSGNKQELVKILLDCDCDSLKFVVRQQGQGFCHLNTWSCFGGHRGLPSLMNTLTSRKQSAPVGSYTDRLYKDSQLLHAKIREEANELCEAENKEDIVWEAADVLYFTLVKCAKAGVSLVDVERVLDKRALKVRRRKGDAKPEMLLNSNGVPGTMATTATAANNETNSPVEAPKSVLRCYEFQSLSKKELQDLCKRPATSDAAKLGPIVKGIIANVCSNGDKALLELTEKFDKVKLASPIIEVSSVQEPLLESKVKDAIDLAYENIFKFHKAQLNLEPMVVETCKGVVCSRHVRPIEKVGLYVPGGSAVLPSTALMLGIPAQVAGCKEVILATPPTLDGFVSHEILYIAKKVGISKILLAGGAQAVAAMAYGTETVPKVDKLCGPGNQFVTLAKMLVQNDSYARISIDMPAGPSEVMVIADDTADPSFVAADLLSQAEHGADSQVVLVAVSLNDKQLQLIQDQVEIQTKILPREQMVRAALSHSFVLNVSSMSQALFFSNKYAPEHLIINAQNAEDCLKDVQNAGSVFLGPYSPESCGDYASGTNHTLPTYGYARMYSGVSTATFMKHITAQCVSQDGLANIGPAVATLAAVENLDAHRNAVLIRQGQINP